MNKIVLKTHSLTYTRLYWKTLYRFWHYTANHFKVNAKTVDLLAGHRILVIAPHIDDDVIGCGGSLYKHQLKHHQVNVLYLAPGDAIRKTEAEQVAQVLGYRNFYFHTALVNYLGEDKSIPGRIAEMLEEIKPDLVYIPFFLDRHTDHVNTNKFFINALNLSRYLHFVVCGYEVWSPLIPNRLVDITSAIDVKVNAIEQCRSQFTGTDYKSLVLGLNQYRGATCGKKDIRFAEAFFCVAPRGYHNLWHSIYGK